MSVSYAGAGLAPLGTWVVRVTTSSTKPYSSACVGSEPAVALGVGLHLLERLTGVLADQLGHLDLRELDLLGLDRDVGGSTADAAGRLVHHDPRVRQRVALAAGAGREQELAHGRGQTHRVGRDVTVDEGHRVEDRHARRDRPAGRVDVQRDVTSRVFGREQQQLCADLVGDRVVDHLPEEDDALAQQPVVHGVAERHAAVRAAHLGCAQRVGVEATHVTDLP